MRVLLTAGLMIAGACCLAAAADQAAPSDEAKWIWTSKAPRPSELVYFRRRVTLDKPVKSAVLRGAADNSFTLFVNGRHLLHHNTWQVPANVELKDALVTGPNVFAIRAENEDGLAALAAEFAIVFVDGSQLKIVTDDSWVATAVVSDDWRTLGCDESAWSRPHVFGPLGTEPWRLSNWKSAAAVPTGLGEATPVDNIRAADGFRVERLYSVPKASQGSWVAMTPDPRGRLIVSDQAGGLYRVTVGKDEAATKVEPIDVPIGAAQGLLWAHDRLYVSVNGTAAPGSGLYAVRDTDGDDRLDEVRPLAKFTGHGEHGPHAIRLGPDGLLYVVAGNFTTIPQGSDGNAPYRNWGEDLLLPRNPDGGGHDPHIMAPGGWVARTDKDGGNWQLFCAGLRNAYDIDFNADGELFTFDSDMEWDTGTPWYRPTRVNHCVSAGEYGWRNGTGKWPDYSVDSLGAVVNLGRGSPTGVCFGTGARLPAKYQRALFVLDWTYGRIHAVHLSPDGGSFSGTSEVVVEGRPLPVTDICVNQDGHLYFTVGGRGMQSGLYRVTYAGEEPTAPTAADDASAAGRAAADSRALRHRLERYHTVRDPAAIAAAWPHLSSDDRSLRFAARVAIERQDVSLWRSRALAETNATAAIQALVALARAESLPSGDSLAREATPPGAKEESQRGPVLAALNKLPLETLPVDRLLDACRAYGLAFIRLGKPDPAQAASAAAALRPLFPHANAAANRELCQLLVYLGDPAAVPAAMEALKRSPTQEEQLFHLLTLRVATSGWTPELRRSYFERLNVAQSTYAGGHSFSRFLARIRADAVERLGAAEKVALADVLEAKPAKEAGAAEPARPFVHDWQLGEFSAADLAAVERGRSFARGQAAFAAAQCAKCHRFAGDGGATGPDISAVGGRFSTQYLLESLIVPSKAISDQYLGAVIQTDDGKVITGRVVDENDRMLRVRANPFTEDVIEVPKDSIEVREPSRISEMPQGLINVLSKEEVLDLIAYLRSGGNAADRAFRQ
jgi:putative heme-binding domain-containing protein